MRKAHRTVLSRRHYRDNPILNDRVKRSIAKDRRVADSMMADAVIQQQKFARPAYRIQLGSSPDPNKVRVLDRLNNTLLSVHQSVEEAAQVRNRYVTRLALGLPIFGPIIERSTLALTV